MRRILAFSVLACLAASHAFAWGTGSGGGTAGGGTEHGSGGGIAGSAEIGADRGTADARGGFGPVGQVEGMRWDDELGCIEGTLTRCNK